jgi:hypothetical protein
MVNIDTVYQRVLALANKEQRGYITPQDFNLFANQAQMEIFEQYFYDVNMARKGQGNDTVYADIDDMLEEKLQIFEKGDGAGTVSAYAGAGGGGINKILPNYIYRVNRVEYNKVVCEILNTKDFNDVKNAPYLLKPTYTRPVANIRNNQLRCFVGTSVTPTGVFYYKIPAKVNWAYIVMNNKAMYNEGGGDVHFELHRSEETQLVNKILKLAGISIKQQDVAQAGQGMEAATIQQQPKI